jgi:hypothetical protein
MEASATHHWLMRVNRLNRSRCLRSALLSGTAEANAGLLILLIAVITRVGHRTKFLQSKNQDAVNRGIGNKNCFPEVTARSPDPRFWNS